MGLRFIYGRAGSGKSTWCLEDIKSKIAAGDDREKILLVPEQFSFQAEKNLLNILGEEGILKAQVLSFKRMSYKVFSEIGGITVEHINNAGKSMLLFDILDSVKDELSAFARAGRQQGFGDIIGKTITEFKRYNITPEALKVEIAENQELSNKLKDINLIYEKFEERLRNNYIDAEDDLTILARKLVDYDGIVNAEIWIDEFETFTPQQYSILEVLLKKAAIVNITLTSDTLNGSKDIDSTDVFHPIKATERKLLNLITDNNISYHKPVQLKQQHRFEKNVELGHLESHFFSFPYKQYAGKTEKITLFRASNPYSEIEAIAREVLSLVRDRGLRFRDIAVVSRDLQAYEKIAGAVFRKHNIPFFLDVKRPIDNNPLIIMLSSALEIYSKNWSYDSVFRYLKTGITGIEREELDLLENYVLANGIRGKRWTDVEDWTFRLNYGFDTEEMSQYEAENLVKINNTKSKVIAPLNKLFANFSKDSTARELCSALFTFTVELGVAERIEGWIKSFTENKVLDKAKEYTQIWNIFIKLLDQLVDVLGDEKIKIDKLTKLLATGIAQYEIGVIPTSLDEVHVGSIDRIKSHSVKCLFIIGVNDGVFPAATNEEGILSDLDRGLLKKYGIVIAEDTKSKAFVEQFLVYTTMSLPEASLNISYPIADQEGKTLRPSIIVSRLKKIFPNLVEQSNVIATNSIEENLKKVNTAEATFSDFLTAMRSELEGIGASEPWADVYRWYMQDSYWKEKSERAFQSFNYNNDVPDLKKDKIKDLYGDKMYLSISRLEKYVECPFAYYVQYGLKAKDRKIYEFSAPDVGTFMHSVLDDFSKVMEVENKDFNDIERSWSDHIISALVDSKVDAKNGFILNSSSRYKYLTHRLKTILKTSVWFMAEQIKRGGFKPKGHEVSFGIEGDFPPINLKLPSGQEINLIGRIDRIDELETEEGTYYRIIDYKSGAKAFKLSDVYYGLQLQLMVYLDAILQNAEKLSKEGVFPGAIFYFRIDDPIIGAEGNMTAEELEAEILKKFKLNGLLLKDSKIVSEMDNGIQGYSLIIPAQMKKDNTLGGNTSGATLEQFQELRSYVRKLVISICEEMLSGNISVSPCRNGKYTPCEYCRFVAVCGFDPNIDGKNVKKLSPLNDEEVLSKISEANKN